MIFSVFIINKAGGLIYHQDFSKSSKRTSNDDLVMAGTFHGYPSITPSFELVGFFLMCLLFFWGM